MPQGYNLYTFAKLKKILTILSIIFFTTQVLPVQYVKHLCTKGSVCTATNADEESNDESHPLKEKGKEDVKPFYKFEVDFLNNKVYIAVAVKAKFSVYCSPTPPNYIQQVLVPPPNC